MHGLKVTLLSLILIIIGFGIAAYKHLVIELPIKPHQTTKAWVIQAQMNFRGQEGPSKVSLEVPKITPGFIIMDEDFISSQYGLSISESKEQRILDWAIRRSIGEQRLYYRASIAQSDLKQQWSSVPPFPKRPDYPEPYGSAAKTIIDDVRTASADVASFTQELLVQLNSSKPNENIELIKDRANTQAEWVNEIIFLLQGVRIPARSIWGFAVNNNVNNVPLEPLLQVHNGTQWLTFEPKTGQRGLPEDFFVWTVGQPPVATLIGGTDLKVMFSITESHLELIDVAHKNADQISSFFFNFSTLSLPIQHQNIYQLLLMMPLGVLLVVFIRVFVGLQTFGTFMPILIAMAFRETQLVWGVIFFIGILAIGLSIRFYLERLMLLLIPRLATILVAVIIIMLMMSILTNGMGVERLLSVSLFPMVIIAMTIERMSIHWEENGALSALGHVFGSLVVAILGYLVMTNATLMFVMFIYPELMLAIIGACLLSGRYTGYRLTELFRFVDIEEVPAKPMPPSPPSKDERAS